MQPSFEIADSFGRIRVSQPETVFDSKQLDDNQPLVWDDRQLSGSGTSSTHSVSRASSVLGVAANTAGVRIRQTYRRFNYQPGKSQLVFATGVLTPEGPVTGVTQIVGYSNGVDGMEFRGSAAGVAVVARSSTPGVSTQVIPQGSWNIDKMDGTGPSKIALDFTKTQIFVFEFEWLGVGTQLFGVVVDRELHYVHQINNANVRPSIYMSTPNLPLRYMIVSDGTNPVPATLEHICTTVISEGGRSISGTPRSYSRRNAPLTTQNDADLYPLFAVRIRPGKESTTVLLNRISVVCTSTAPYEWVLLRDPSFTGTALSWTSMTSSSVDVATPSSATKINTATGVLVELAGGLGANDVSGSLQPLVDFYLGFDALGNSIPLVIGIRRLTGTAETFYGSVSWMEQSLQNLSLAVISS